MPKYNNEQQLALDTPLHQNVVVSAGAGSGKTNTLTEKVSRLLTDTNLTPSELLILTFTNNAAHEMKTRIIEKCESYPDIKDKILSSHIQTFDSFNEYLVSKYSSCLGIADNIAIASQYVINAKLSSLVEEIFEEYYQNDNNYHRILNTLKKISLHDDNPLKKIVINVYHHLNSLLPSQRKAFHENSRSLFIDKSFYEKELDNYLLYYKNIIVEAIYEAYFVEKYYDGYLNNLDGTKEVFDSEAFVHLLEQDYSRFHFDNELNQKVYSYLLSLLSLDNERFIKEVKLTLLKKNEIGKLFEGKLKNDDYPNISDKEVAKQLRKTLATQKAKLYPLINFGILNESDNEIDIDKEYQKIASFKDDIVLILEIVEELDRRLFNYQKETNCYTFQTISRLALSLFDNKGIANEIRETFKYIMIDEYQDTNDLQELYISHLLKPRQSDHQSATLFVVGDAKQSIYGFRNANVELFKTRQSDKTTNPLVINMNKNYRSGEKLLNEINYIFSHYMKLMHGGINYRSTGEALSYDKDVNLYNKEYEHFGIERILSTSRNNYDGLIYSKERQEWEALAIINDIKRKINDPTYMISERSKEGNVIRHVEYRDFAILVRKKSGFPLYQKLFSQYHIPLNIISTSSLQEVDAIIVIESLVNLMAYIMGIEVEVDVRHIFASLARNYIYQYNDQQLFDLLMSDVGLDTKDISRISKDQIYLDVENFVNNHAHESFSTLFLSLINEFHVEEKLYLIGNVKDNINSIESLYTIIQSSEEMGEGIKEFIILLKNISKYRLDMDTENEISLTNAVDIMSIHASKGLERKIVYLPNSFNKLADEDSRNKPDYLFSKERGIILPYYHIDLKREGEYYSFDPVYTKTLYELIEDNKSNQFEIDEHVRLFYVALTRAENTIIIVGDPGKPQSDINEENLYGMLNHLPRYPLYNPDVFNLLNSIASKEDIMIFNKDVSLLKLDGPKLTEEIFNNSKTYERYLNFYQDLFKNKLNEEVDGLLEKFDNTLFQYYYQKASTSIFDELDPLAVLYAEFHCYVKVKDFASLMAYFDSIGLPENQLEFKEYLLKDFSFNLKEGQYQELGINLSDTAKRDFAKLKKDYQNVPLELKSSLLLPLMKLIDGYDYIYYWSYHSDHYEDKISTFNYYSFPKVKKIDRPDIDIGKVDNTPINFIKRFHEKASKYVEEDNRDLEAIFTRGTYLHHLLELVDFNTLDTSFIYNPKDRLLIDKVLAMDIFKEVREAKAVYKEYPYYDAKRMSNGFIDLFYISKDNVYTIVDYKSRHTDDDAYKIQLEIYKENIINLFKLNSETKFRLVLLSIAEQKLYEVKE